MLSWLWAWFRRHPRLVDSGGAAFVLLFGLPWLASGPDASMYPVGGHLVVILIVLALAAPLCWVRRAPTLVFGIVAAVAFVQWAVGLTPLPPDLALLIAAYQVAAQSRRRNTVLAFLTMALGAALAGARWPSGVEDKVVSAVVLTIVSLVAFVLGDSVRSRRAYYAELEARAERLERERAQEAQLAVAEERSRIAREMHDVVAHNVSVMVVQAEGAAYMLDSDPRRTRTALETVSSTGRKALAEMRRLLGVLRSGEDAASGAQLAPQPGAADIEALVAQVAAAGPRVGLEGLDDVNAIDPGVGLVAYRVVQEALTNVLKHAGPAAHTTVRLRQSPGALEVSVTDDGRGVAADATDGRGHGLTGMRERVAVYGGTLHAGPRVGGGFEVSARIPVGIAGRMVQQ